MSTRRDLDSEDMFADTRMTFGEHLEDLRTHLIRAICGFLIALCFGLMMGKTALRVISQPVTDQLRAFYDAHAKTVVEKRDTDAEAKMANRPRVVWFSVPRALLDRQAAQQPLPDGPIPFGDLLERATVDLVNLDEALGRNKWDKLPPLTDDLAQIAERVKTASELPDGRDKNFASDLSKQLADATDALRAAVAQQDRGQARTALMHLKPRFPLDDLAGDRMISIPVQIDEPLLFSFVLNDPLSLVQDRFGLSTLSVQEAIMAWFKVSVVCGLVLGSPWIFYQIWLFIAAGLYPHEKRLVNVYLPISTFLFLAGVFICQVFVIPKAIEALLWFNEWVGFKPDLRFNEWLSFAIMMPLVFGVSFQLPLVMLFLERIGVVTVQTYLSQWKIAVFLIHVFAALITPSVDLISMELLALPMLGLYGLGILLCKLRPPRGTGLDIEVPDSEEPVGV